MQIFEIHGNLSKGLHGPIETVERLPLSFFNESAKLFKDSEDSQPSEPPCIISINYVGWALDNSVIPLCKEPHKLNNPHPVFKEWGLQLKDFALHHIAQIVQVVHHLLLNGKNLGRDVHKVWDAQHFWPAHKNQGLIEDWGDHFTRARVLNIWQQQSMIAVNFNYSWLVFLGLQCSTWLSLHVYIALDLFFSTFLRDGSLRVFARWNFLGWISIIYLCLNLSHSWSCVKIDTGLLLWGLSLGTILTEGP